MWRAIIGTLVVSKLLENHLGKEYVVGMDNFFTLIELFEELASNEIYAI